MTFYPKSSSGVSVDNNGSAIPNTPHSTLNLIGWVKASDSGSGVAAIVVGPTTTSVAYGSTTTLDASTTVLLVGASGSGTTAVNAPTVSGVITTGWTFAVADVGANSTIVSNYITVSGNGVNIEDPNAPGTFASAVVMRINSGAVQWVYDGTHWKIIYIFYPNRITVFLTTTDSSAHAIYNFPMSANTVNSIKVRFVARDTSTIGASGAGEYYVVGTYNGTTSALISPSEITQVAGGNIVNMIWRAPAVGSTFAVTFDTSGGANVVTVKVTAPTTDSTKWRVDVEPQVSQ